MAKAYDRGKEAFDIGLGMEACPHPSRTSKGESNQRIEWFNGFLDARTKKKLGHIFEKEKED